MTQHEDRDLVVAEALGRLDVPEHRPGFFSELHGRLEDRAVQPARRLRSRLPYAAAAAVAAVAAVVAVAVVQLSTGTPRQAPVHRCQRVRLRTARIRAPKRFVHRGRR